MSLADRLAQNAKRPGFTCQLGRFFDDLPDKDKAEFLEAFHDNTRISASVLSDYLISTGNHITINQVAVHRRNLCRTCRDAGRFHP